MGCHCMEDTQHILSRQNWPRFRPWIDTTVRIFVPSAIVARLCAIAFDLSALTLRACIFNPVLIMADRESGYTGPWPVSCSACYVHGLFLNVRLVGLDNGKRKLSFCVPYSCGVGGFSSCARKRYRPTSVSRGRNLVTGAFAVSRSGVL